MTKAEGDRLASAELKPDTKVTTGAPWLPQSSFPV